MKGKNRTKKNKEVTSQEQVLEVRFQKINVKCQLLMATLGNLLKMLGDLRQICFYLWLNLFSIHQISGFGARIWLVYVYWSV